MIAAMTDAESSFKRDISTESAGLTGQDKGNVDKTLFIGFQSIAYPESPE